MECCVCWSVPGNKTYGEVIYFTAFFLKVWGLFKTLLLIYVTRQAETLWPARAKGRVQV